MIRKTQLQELILQSLEHEQGGVQVYESAVACATREDLREEWQKYLKQTRNHVQVLQDVCKELQIDPEQQSPGKNVIRHLGSALVQAMKLAKEGGDPVAAELVACECVVLAETKDHADWELLGKCAEKLKGKEKKALTAACEEVEEEEDEHLYHTKGWCRELWLDSLGLEAVLPPPEEEKDVKTAIGASRAQHASERERPH
jgi:rubrerythrin